MVTLRLDRDTVSGRYKSLVKPTISVRQGSLVQITQDCVKGDYIVARIHADGFMLISVDNGNRWTDDVFGTVENVSSYLSKLKYVVVVK